MVFDMILSDVWAIMLSFSYVILVVGSAKKLRDLGYSSNLLREITHIVIGIWPLLWLLFTYNISAFLVPLIVTIMLATAPENIRRVFSEGEEKHIGLVFYAFSFTVVTYFYWKNFAGAAAIFCLSFGDGLGGLIGSRYGKHKYKLPWVKEKSIEGSLTIFFVALLVITIAQLIYPPSIGVTFLLSLVGAVLVTVIEAISPYHSDNLTIPLIMAPLLNFMATLL